MKTKLYTLAAFAAAVLMAASCSQEAIDPSAINGEEEEIVQGEFTIGGFASEDPDTKLAVESKKGGSYPCVWSAGDQIGIRNSSGNTIFTGTLSSGAGENYGTFNLASGSTSPSLNATLRVVYPLSRMMSFTSGTLESDQVQAGAGNRNNVISDYDFAYADVKYTKAGLPSSFTMTHLLSYVRVAVSSEKFSGTTLNSITLRCPGAALSGAFSTNYSTLAISPISGKDYVKVNFKDPLILNAARKDIWLAVLPADLTGKTVTLTFNITTADETLEVSTSLDGVLLEQGKAYSLDRTGFDPVPGYCPSDTRIRAGEGHAYGQANTFLIQCKDGSTYTGGTYKPDPDIPQSVVIDYRVRGDRQSAVIPDGVSFGWATKSYGITQNPSSAYLPRYSDYSASGVDPSGFTFSVDEANYTVTVTNVSAHAGSPILLMMKDDKILWGWTFWNIAADGTELAVETLGSSAYQLANMDIGQPTTNYEAWCANKSGSNPDPIWRMTMKYQWGRYLPVFWNSYWSLCIPGTSFKGNVPAIQGPVSLEESLEHPYGLVVPEATAVNNTITEWQDSPDGSLWGNLSTDQNSVGQKTIYDPCPKGWRVPDFYNLQSRRYSETWTAVTTSGYYGWSGSKSMTWGVTTGTFFPAGGVILNKIGNLSDTEARVSTAGGNNTGTSGAGGWWTNFTSQSGNHPASLGSLSTGGTPAANPGWFASGVSSSQPSKAHALAVRCMPDNDER